MLINEDEFLEAFLPTLTQAKDVIVPPGDDCAALDMGDGLLLLAVDQIAEGTHYFGIDAASPTDIRMAGRKLVARNLSDIAAMGGIPKYALTAIGMPKNASLDRLLDLSAGIKDTVTEFEVSLIGGDLTEGPGEFASLTIIGHVSSSDICLRSNATAGDRIYVTGRFGGSLPSGRHLSFQPRLKEGRWLAENKMTCCMIDASDGLVKDLSRLCRSSGLGAQIDETKIPVHSDCGLKDALYDGEDYELIFSVKAENGDALRRSWPFTTQLTEIGTFITGPAVVLSLTRGRASLDGPGMFNHFKG